MLTDGTSFFMWSDFSNSGIRRIEVFDHDLNFLGSFSVVNFNINSLLSHLRYETFI